MSNRMKTKLLILTAIALLLGGCATTRERDQLNAKIDAQRSYFNGRLAMQSGSIKALDQSVEHFRTELRQSLKENRVDFDKQLDTFAIEYIGWRIYESRNEADAQFWINEACKACRRACEE